jgi:hypothetical protein
VPWNDALGNELPDPLTTQAKDRGKTFGSDFQAGDVGRAERRAGSPERHNDRLWRGVGRRLGRRLAARHAKKMVLDTNLRPRASV